MQVIQYLTCLLLILVTQQSLALKMFHDPKTALQSAKHYTQEMSHWKQEIEHWKQSIKGITQQNNMLKEQLASFTSIRDIGDLEGQLSSLHGELDGIERHRDMLNNMLRSGDGQDYAQSSEIISKYPMFETCDHQGNQELGNICREEILNKAGTIEQGDVVRKQMNRKMKEAQILAQKARASKDIKESQDIANAISLKELEINRLQQQWRSLVDESMLREKLIEQKKLKAFNEQQRNAPIPKFNFKI